MTFLEAVNYLCPKAECIHGDGKIIKWLDKRDQPSDDEIKNVLNSSISSEHDKEKAMKILRRMRNSKLSETDWWALSDITMSEEQKSYRNELRQLPQKIINGEVDYPKLVGNFEIEFNNWPTKP